MSLPRFLVSTSDLLGTSVRITGREHHHLRVRRVGVGESIVLTDGKGAERAGTVCAVHAAYTDITLTGVDVRQPSQPLHIVLAQALIKPQRLEIVLEKATELGVHTILLTTTERSFTAVSDTRRSRWRRIIDDAAKQSQRTTVPELVGPLPLARVVQNATEAGSFFFHERTPLLQTLATVASVRPHRVLAFIGPSGGFSQNEADFLRSAEVQPITLGPRVLRSETAAIVALTLIQALWGDLAPHKAEP